MDERERQRRELTKERELELFYTKTSPKRLRLAGLISGVLMPWILAAIVLLSLVVVNLYDYMMWRQWEFDPSDLFNETNVGLIVVTIILGVIGFIAAGAFPMEKVRSFQNGYLLFQALQLLCHRLLAFVPFWFNVDHGRHFSILGFERLCHQFCGCTGSYPYWKALFNKIIYYVATTMPSVRSSRR